VDTGQVTLPTSTVTTGPGRTPSRRGWRGRVGACTLAGRSVSILRASGSERISISFRAERGRFSLSPSYSFRAERDHFSSSSSVDRTEVISLSLLGAERVSSSSTSEAMTLCQSASLLRASARTCPFSRGARSSLRILVVERGARLYTVECSKECRDRPRLERGRGIQPERGEKSILLRTLSEGEGCVTSALASLSSRTRNTQLFPARPSPIAPCFRHFSIASRFLSPSFVYILD
jgi:hypothetical protein